MRVLVSAASRHGATAEMAAVVADTLAGAGLEAAVLAPDDVKTLDGFDAVVLGSAVYIGQWMDPAKHLVERFAKELAARPVWLFSSGPVGDPPKPEEDPVDVSEIVATTGARGHHLFTGKVDKAMLGLGEKVILKAVRVPEGDYRPWDEVRAWAGEIATALKAS